MSFIQSVGPFKNPFAAKISSHKQPYNPAKGPIPAAAKTTRTLTKTEKLIEMDKKYNARNYSPLEVVLARGQGVHVWDVEGVKYFDFLAGYSASNQGHSHPKIVQALVEQSKNLTLTSRAFYNDQLPIFAEYLTSLFKYDKFLPTNSGAEAVETAIKISKKWGYLQKKIPKNEAIVISASDCFHGRTSACISLSTDPQARDDFEPFLPQIEKVKFNDANDLERALRKYGPKVACFIVEPIQGEAGILIPDKGYLQKCQQLCKQHNVLFVVDEIQTGLGRTGKLLAIDHEGVRPDILILAKALTGGVYPMSVVLADNVVMDCIKPGEHGSTYGGNPLACRVAHVAIQTLIDEKMPENSAKMGEIFLSELNKLKQQHPFIKHVRGRGLMDAIEIDNSTGVCAYDVCLKMKDHGILAKPTHEHTIRFTPPLIITEPQLGEALHRIKSALSDF